MLMLTKQRNRRPHYTLVHTQLSNGLKLFKLWHAQQGRRVSLETTLIL